jgi:hypothetical protein
MYPSGPTFFEKSAKTIYKFSGLSDKDKEVNAIGNRSPGLSGQMQVKIVLELSRYQKIESLLLSL